MAVSMNSVISFSPPASYQQITRTNVRALLLKINPVTPSLGVVELRQLMNRKRSGYCISVADGDQVATETTEKDSKTIKGSYSDDWSSDNLTFANSSETEDKIGPSDESGLAPLVSEDSNGSVNSTNLNQDTSASTSRSTLKRAPLTARERLRAARVLNRYTEPKPSKPVLGSKLLEALKETDKGKKRPGLPEAPTNLFDDSKRGLPEQGWTINIIPGGMDVFLVIFSFVFISSVMFATTYIVWKVGAIHFNEY